MGVQGLRRWLEERFGKSVQMVDPHQDTASFDGVFIDLNSLLYACGAIGVMKEKEVIAELLKELDRITLQLAIPTSFLALCVDGPAPISKIPLQRGRRRQAACNTKKGAEHFTRLGLTPGSSFMASVKQALVQWAKKRQASKHPCNTLVVSGDDVAGEGEAKIFTLLQHQLKGEFCGRSYCLVGNDSDLVLGALCAVHAINLTILDAQSGMVTYVGELCAYWLRDGPFDVGEGAKGKGFADTASLPGTRLDFVLISLLAGNDYLPALEGIDAHSVWITYAKLRATKGFRHLVSADLGINTGALVELLGEALKDKGRGVSGKEPEGACKAYLHGLAWNMHMLAGWGCSDYTFSFDENAAPHAAALVTYILQNRPKKAMKRTKPGGRPALVTAPRSDAMPPAPLLYFACVMPPEAYWILPKEFQDCISSSRKKKPKQLDEVGMAALSLLQPLSAASTVEAVTTVFNSINLPPHQQRGLKFGAEREITASGEKDYECSWKGGGLPLVQVGRMPVLRSFEGSEPAWFVEGQSTNASQGSKRTRRNSCHSSTDSKPRVMQLAISLDFDD